MTLHASTPGGNPAGSNGHVPSSQKFKGDFRCPICGGTEDDSRGQGSRCFGYRSSDGKWAHCTREEHAGRSPQNLKSSTYPHLLKGPCPCGTEHAPADPKPPRKRQGEWDRSYPYNDPDDKLLYEVVRFKNPKGFAQRRPVGGGKYEWNLKGVGLVPYRLPELLASVPSCLVFVVEGEKDVDNLIARGFVATCNPMGAGKWREELSGHLAGRSVAILPDNDAPGRDHAQHVARSLHGKAKEVKVVELPGLPEHGDVTDWFAGGGTVERLRQLAIEAPEWEQSAEPQPEPGVTSKPRQPTPEIDGDDIRPEIICGSDDPSEGLKTWTPKAISALAEYNNPPRIYQRGAALIRIKPGDTEAPPTIEPLSIDALRGELDRAASWGSQVFTKKGVTIQYGPPRLDVVRDFAALPGWDPVIIPKLDAVVETPRFLADGRLLCEPGYHADARLFYAPGEGLDGLVIPERPTARQVKAAKSLLLDDLLIDFSFANQASRAGAVAFTLLPFVRSMIAGPTPLHHVSASTEGTGKTLLVIACAWPSLGREINLTPQKESDAEWRKAITTAFMVGATHFSIDNLNNPLGWDDIPIPVDSGVLAMALTAPFYTDRILGGNTEARIRVSAVFSSTGNNTMFSRELTRRIVPIELIAPIENPSLRTGFKHNPLLDEFVAPRRRDLLVACLTICRHWIAEGRPAGSEVIGRYEAYAQTMGGILGSIGVEGFLANRKGLMGRNPQGTQWKALADAWKEKHGLGLVTAGDLWGTITGSSDLQVAFAEVLGDKSVLSQKQKLGKALEKQTNQVWGEWRITRSTAKPRNGSALYRLKLASEPFAETTDEDDESEGEHATSCSAEDWSAF